jgi:hypothetical protein
VSGVGGNHDHALHASPDLGDGEARYRFTVNVSVLVVIVPPDVVKLAFVVSLLLFEPLRSFRPFAVSLSLTIPLLAA